MLQSINDLVADEWIEPETRVVFVDFLMYNYYLNIYTHVKIIFEIDVTGVVKPDLKLKGIHSHHKENGKHSFDVTSIIVSIFLLYYILEEIHEIIFFKTEYFLRIGNIIDNCLLVAGILTVFYNMYCNENYLDKINALKENREIYVDLEKVADQDAFVKKLMAGFLFICYMKLFRFMNFHRSLGILNETMSRCFPMLFVCSLQLLLLILVYAYIGVIIFGVKTKDYSTIGVGFFTLFRTIIGDFSYKDIKLSNPNLAICFFFSYLALVFFIMLNLFVAIIGETFSEVKQEIAMTPDYVDMSTYIKLLLAKLKFHKYEKNPISDYTKLLLFVRNSLKGLGFSNLEIEIYFANQGIDIHDEEGNVDKLLQVLEKSETEDKTTTTQNDFQEVTPAQMIGRMKRLEAIDLNLYYLSEKYEHLYNLLLGYKLETDE